MRLMYLLVCHEHTSITTEPVTKNMIEIGLSLVCYCLMFVYVETGIDQLAFLNVMVV
jgi:hypothetical protein